MAEVFKLVPTPDPSRVSIRVKVSTANIRDGQIPDVGTPYRDLANTDARRVTEEGESGIGWGDYIYAYLQPSESDGFIEFIYVRPNTPQEIANPVPFRSWTSYERLKESEFPAVLEVLPSGRVIDFSENNAFPFNKPVNDFTDYASTPRILVRYALRPPFDGEVKVRTDLYLSASKWSDRALEVVTPQPSRVRWNHLTTTEDLGECLHDTIVIPAFGVVTTRASGQIRNAPPTTETEILPPTNYISWEDHRISATQEYTDGLWLVTIKTAYCPEKLDLTATLL